MSQVANNRLKEEFSKILFVDDEPRVLNTMRAMFRRQYRVWTASSAQEALDLLAKEEVDVVVSDQRMPGMTGVEMLTQIKTLAPNTMRILLTGYADLTAIEASINEGEVFRYLMKPCPPDELRGAVALAIEASQQVNVPMRNVIAEGSGSSVDANIVSFPAPVSRGIEASTEEATAQKADPEEDLEAGSAKVHHDEWEKQNIPVEEIPVDSVDLTSCAPEKPAALQVASKRRPSQEHRVDLLLLTKDQALIEGVSKANQDEHSMHCASDVAEALELIGSYPIGIMITDIVKHEREINNLTAFLKQEVPELITIIASKRSDATTLIQLINSGQIFRFLLKPVHTGQCRLWLNSAVTRYFELVDSPDALKRHVIAGVTSNTGRPAWLDQVHKGISHFRERLAAWKQRV